MSDGVTLITCTGLRPHAFALCQRYVMQQTYKGPIQWIVVDDGGRPSQISALAPNMTLDVLRPQPYWQPGQNTLARNLLAAIPHVVHDKIMFIEDDDAYMPNYVKVTAADLEDHLIVGETHARYYYAPRRKAQVHGNKKHASLCQTGIRRELLPLVATVCKLPGHAEDWDMALWHEAPKRRNLRNTALCVGMKGLPGRPGIGYGHRPSVNFRDWTDDSSLMILHCWIGENAELYREFFIPPEKQTRVPAYLFS